MILRVFLGAALATAAFAQVRNDSRNELLNRGIDAYRNARYNEATRLFEQVVATDPGSADARLYLGSAYLSQWIPGAESPENRDLARRAREQFEAVLAANPKQPQALVSLAMLAFSEGSMEKSPAAKNRAFDEADKWNRRVIEIDPKNKQAWYSLGVTAWSRAYPEFQAARGRAGMKPEDPGPIRDFNSRSDLSNRLGSVIADGMKDLEQALTIDSQYDDAMAYMSLLYRLRADIADASDQYYRDIARADEFVNKALETKKIKAEAGSGQYSYAPPPPPPPGGSVPATAQRIRVGGNVQAYNLVEKVTPVYPQEAKDARIQGTVRFTVVIGKDGRVQDIQLVSGHQLLAQAAQDAVRQWVYKPTLLNGQPVEVVTQVDVNFTLSQ